MNRPALLRLALLGAGLLATGFAPPPAGEAELEPTVIDSVQLDMHSTDTETTFVFTKNVVATGTDMRLTCDRLTVVTTRQGDPAATIGKLGHFKSLLAEGHVFLVQSGREAACGRAEVLPDDDKIILTDRPVVKDLSNGATATGPRMVLYRGERRAVIEGTDDSGSRIVLPAVKDLGFDKEKGKNPAPPAAEAPQKP